MVENLLRCNECLILIDFLKILDNLRVYHIKVVQQWQVENADRTKVIYLSSYSPELNPNKLLNADLRQ